jgi:hypothetical protein
MLESLFDKETLAQMKACTRAKFPQCLDEALLKIFGKSSRKSMNRIIADTTIQDTSISSAKDIWNLYDEYLARTADRFGIDVTQVIRFETLRQMELMFCTKCPLYEKKAGPSNQKEAELAQNVSSVRSVKKAKSD